MKRLSGKYFFVSFCSAVLAISACGASGGSGGGGLFYDTGFVSMNKAASAPSAAYAESAVRQELGYDAESPAESPVLPAEAELSRKLIKNAELRVRVEDPAAAEKPLSDLIKKYNAWPASTGIYENSRDYSIRVPSASYDAMLADLAGLGKMLTRTENTEDVTLRYYDLEGRLATRQELLSTYRSYLARAADIEEIMTVESKIADLQYEIDSTGTQLRNLASLVDYSTINLEIIGPVSAPSYSRPTLREKLTELFGSFGEAASSAMVVLVGIVIYGIPAVLIITLLFFLLFGRVGLLKKLWRLAAGKKTAEPEE